MKTIYKYEIPLEDRFTVEMPESARILTVQVQNEKPFMWAILTTLAPTKTRSFLTVGTGQQIDNSLRLDYIETFQLFEGKFVGHLFEII